MQQRSKVNLGRALFTLAWLAVAMGAVYWKSPRFWAIGNSTAEAHRFIAHGDLDQAAAAVARARAADPGNPDLLVLWGGLELRRGHAQEAAKAFSAALARNPQSSDARLGLADVLVSENHKADALELLVPMRERPLSAEQRRRRLGLIARTGDTKVLASSAAESLQARPADPIALGYALDAAEAQHQWQEAASFAGRLAIATADPGARRLAVLRQARAHEAAGDLTAAFDLYSQAAGNETLAARTRLAMATGQFDAAARLFAERPVQQLTATDRADYAYALQRSGRVPDALAVYRSALAAGALDNVARVRYAWLLNVGHRYAEAWDVVAHLPNDGRGALEVRARTAAWAGQLDAAATLLPLWLKQAPRDTAAWALLAETDRRRGDAAAQTAALKKVVELRPGDTNVQRDLAVQLVASGNVDAAIAQYQQMLQRTNDDPTALAAIALLYEQSGRLADAIDASRELTRRGGATEGVQLRLARLLRWTAQPDQAAIAYQEYLTASSSRQPDVEGELGLALADAGRFTDALDHFDTVLTTDRAEPALFVAAANAASKAGLPARTAVYLRALSDVRPLTEDETKWLAGQLEASGDLDRALAVYHELARSGARDDQPWERIGDILALQDRPAAALEAYSQVTALGDEPSFWRKVARTAAAAGNRDTAAAAYVQALSWAHDGTELTLEAARYHASVGEPARALALYDRYLVASRSASGLYLELARTSLAASLPDEALRWAVAGIAAGERSVELQYARAQALHLTHRTREAAAALHELLAENPQNSEWLTWLARTAQARGRDLEAYELFGAALTNASGPSADLWLARADAAASWGDVAHAARNYEQARLAGADAAVIDQRTRDLTGRVAPQLAAPVDVLRDSNGVAVTQSGGQLLFWPAQSARVKAAWATSRVTQGSYSFGSRGLTADVDQVFITPHLKVQGGAGFQHYDAGTNPVWNGRATYQWTRGGAIAVEGFRESPWTAEIPGNVPRFNRVNDVAAVGPLFHDTGVRAQIDVPLKDGQALSGEAGFKRYSDSNQQTDVYLQYQRARSVGPGTWIAVQPNVYVEQWAAQNPAYFSPERHASVGVTLRTMVERGIWTVDASVTPQALFTDGSNGAGLNVAGGARARIRGGSVGANVMIMDDHRHAYVLRRFTADVRIPVGK
jgi:predicted Zn-dependent protease